MLVQWFRDRIPQGQRCLEQGWHFERHGRQCGRVHSQDEGASGLGCGGCWMQYWSTQWWVFSKICCCPSMYMHFRLAFLLCSSCQFDFHKVLSVSINRSRSPATWEQPKTERSDQACVCVRPQMLATWSATWSVCADSQHRTFCRTFGQHRFWKILRHWLRSKGTKPNIWTADRRARLWEDARIRICIEVQSQHWRFCMFLNQPCKFGLHLHLIQANRQGGFVRTFQSRGLSAAASQHSLFFVSTCHRLYEMAYCQRFILPISRQSYLPVGEHQRCPCSRRSIWDNSREAATLPFFFLV